MKTYTTNYNKQLRSVIELFKEFFLIKLNRWFILSSIVLFIGVTIYLIFTSNYQVFPNIKKFSYQFFTDSLVGGHSQILHHQISDSSVEMSYILKKGQYDANVGINFYPHNNKTINIAAFDHLKIEINAPGLSNIIIFLVTENINTDIRHINEVFFVGNIEINPTKDQYYLKLDRLKVPDWWYGAYNVLPSKNVMPDFQHVKRFSISTGLVNNDKDAEHFIKMHSLSFVKNDWKLLLWMGLIEFSVLLFLFANYFIRKISVKQPLPVTITYKSVEIEKNIKIEKNYLEYLNQNMYNNNLSLDLVSETTGISQRRIASEIQQKFGCNFKTYINQIRINESKRLLKETTLNIGEIAFKVGFSSPNHFNRVFKLMVEKSPTEFREA